MNTRSPKSSSTKAETAKSPTARSLLAWYDRERRELPWRRLPGGTADPYAVWLSEIMLQQTTVTAVIPYFEKFLSAWPTLESLAAAPRDKVLAAWAGLGYYSRARNLHACAQVLVEEWGGRFPETAKELETLPGIGAYTSAAIAAIAFGEAVPVVDGNVERVVTRQFALATPLPKVKGEVRERLADLVPKSRPGDFAEAMMDLGATLCTPRSPACDRCPWMKTCLSFQAGDPERYPVRPPRKEKPTRRGLAFVVLREDGAVLLEQRPEKGLLAAMWQPPMGPWEPVSARRAFAEKEALAHAPLPMEWQRLSGLVTHTFTHFHLELTVLRAAAPLGYNPERGRFVAPADLADHALPSIMKKVLAHAKA